MRPLHPHGGFDPGRFVNPALRQQQQQMQRAPTFQEVRDFMNQGFAAVTEQCRGVLEAVENRVANLELLVQEHSSQAPQLQQLINETNARLSQDIFTLRVEHTTLRENTSALCECLIGCQSLQASELHARRRVCDGLHALRAALNEKRVMLSVQQLADDRGFGINSLSMTSRTFCCMQQNYDVDGRALPKRSKADSAGHATASTSETDGLDEDVWGKIKDYEPPRSTLDLWDESVTVHKALGGLKAEGVIGKTRRVKFQDVYKLFPQIGLTMERFVNKFTHVQRTIRSSTDLEDLANKILRKFATHPESGKDILHCRDLFRLLEIVGFPLQRFKNIYNDADDAQDKVTQSMQRFGSYRVRRQIDRTLQGGCCYLGEHVVENTQVAIKWPAPKDEALVLKAIHEKAPKDCLGLPRLLASGELEQQPYIVTELLGSSLTKVFERLGGQPFKQRWKALRVIGRLVVRRLQALHQCGYVHCDVSPGNILLGHARSGSKTDDTRFALFLIDFEHALRYPGGSALRSDVGSAEWSSIRSADGGERLPEDDLEAVGWILLHGLAGSLPWFEWLTEAYKDWDSTWTRAHVVKQVQRAKIQLLDQGWKAFDRRRSAGIPADVARFIRACNPDGATPGHPDYGRLFELLGGDKRLSSQEAEVADLDQFAELVTPLL